MPIIQFPTEEEWRQIYNATPFDAFLERVFNVLRHEVPRTGILSVMRGIEIRELQFQLYYRLTDITKSYVLLKYYYSEGIPDDEWYRSPGKLGASIEYFPHFENIHYQIKDWFDYYADTFYFKLFSYFDTIGHLLNSTFTLEISQPTFTKALSASIERGLSVSQALTDLSKSDTFQDARKIRNDIAHNYLPSSTGMMVTTEGAKTSLGLRPYLTSTKIMENCKECIGILEESIGILLDDSYS